jgi:hypothetical protein
MDPRTAGWVGAVAGTLLGVGGVIVTYFSIKNTNGPRERSFVVRCAAALWASVAALLIALYLTPMPYWFLVWLPYALFMPVMIRVGNRRQDMIRKEEAEEAGAEG